MPTIKRKVEMNLPELIEWGFENDITGTMFSGDRVEAKKIRFEVGIIVKLFGDLCKNDTFTIEIEEPITEDMKFQHTVERFITRYVNEYRYATHDNKSIKDILNNRPPHVETTHIYAEVENELMLIWKNGKMVD